MDVNTGVSENRGPEYRTLNSRILIVRTPKYGTPNFRNTAGCLNNARRRHVGGNQRPCKDLAR